MIVGVGTDIVAVQRFESWQSFSQDRLKRIFSQHELDYCSDAQGRYVLERLAVRFAAKEACYKALSGFIDQKNQGQRMVPFLTLAPLIEVFNSTSGVPYLRINWQEAQGLQVHASFSHEKEYALAFVVLEQFI